MILKQMKKNKNIDIELLRCLIINKLLENNISYNTIAQLFNRKSKSYIYYYKERYNYFLKTNKFKELLNLIYKNE